MSAREIKATVDSAWRHPPGKSETYKKGQLHATSPSPPALSEDWSPDLWQARDLVGRDLGELRWLVRDLLPAGLCLFVASSKAGKSWWTYNLAGAIASGQSALGHFDVPEPAEVLYLDLEQGERRAQSRVRKLFGGSQVPEGILGTNHWPRIDQGGVQALERTLDAHPKVGLVVIDTLFRIWPASSADRFGTAYHSEFAVMEQIQQLAEKREVAIVLVHHDNKLDVDEDDPLRSISGTNALAGASDTIWIMHRPRGKLRGWLYLTGKDVEEKRFNIQFRPETCWWVVEDEKREMRT
jgi:hypothetical protein